MFTHVTNSLQTNQRAITHVALFIVFCLCFIPIALADDRNDDELRVCLSDADCIIVQDGCCGCFAGGKATSINHAWQAQWENKLASKCFDVVCAMMISDHWTCQAQAACVDGVCTLIPNGFE